MKIKPRNEKIAYLSALLLVVIIMAVFITYPDLTVWTPGSFEYIRKGEALLDRGRYLDAIRYYEKAYDQSPDNETIRDSLVYIYSRYAVALSESKKYDMGIQYLSKAFGVVQSTYTRQNLALMYGVRALVESRMSNWEKTQEYLNAAREVVDGSASSERNLGISLFNDAVGEYKALREDSAIMILKEAVIVYPDSRIAEFLSDIYYKRTDLDKALLYLDKAIKVDSGNSKLSEKRERIIKEKALFDVEKRSALPYFDLRYEKDLPVDAEAMGKILEKAYIEVGEDLSFFPKARTAIFFYSEKNFREIFRMRDIVRAFYDGNIRIPLPAASSGEKELVSYLYHEYTHAIISAKTNNNCPVWLSEGIAVYEELKRTRPGALVNIPESALTDPGVSVQALEGVFGDPAADPGRLVLTYMLAYTAVEYIVEGWGMKALDGVLSRISSGSHAVNAIDDELLMSEKEFNRRWSDFVIRKYINKGG